MQTRTLDLGWTFRYQTTQPTAAIFMTTPESTERVPIIGAERSNDRDVVEHEYRDLYGNLCHRMVLPTGQTTMTWKAQAIVPDELDEADETAQESRAADLPDDVLVYTLASRFVLPDVLGHIAWSRFGQLEPGYQRVQAISEWVHDYLTYTTGSTTALSTAVDAYSTGQGVCRDFTHLMISLCRALNIPARYACGLLPDMDVPPLPTAMDFHAWVQVWIGDRWYDFDPRHGVRRKGRVKIAHGRDAADVALVTTYGAPWLQLMTVTCHEAAQA